MAKPKTTAQVLAKYVRNATASAPSYVEGIRGVTQAPGAKAAAKADDWFQGVQSAHSEGRYARNVAAVTLQDWQASAEAGASRIAAGIKKGEAKMGKFLDRYLPFVAQVSSQIDSMPSSTEADRDARMLENVRLLRGFKKR